jgi:hypothetical protein
MNPVERALQATVLSRETRSRATETPMPRRASSFGPIISGFVCVLLAAATPGFVGLARAECIAQPNQQAPDGAHWSLQFDRAKNRRCWVLVDSAGQDLSAPEPRSAASTGLSQFQSFISNLTGSPPAQSPETSASAAAAQPPKPRVARPRVASANGAPRTEQKADAQPAKQEMTREERDALFEEFLRWKSQNITPANPR